MSTYLLTWSPKRWRWEDLPARIREITREHRHLAEITVHDGWYALAWNDRSGHVGFGGHLIAYDKNGKILHQH